MQPTCMCGILRVTSAAIKSLLSLPSLHPSHFPTPHLLLPFEKKKVNHTLTHVRTEYSYCIVIEQVKEYARERCLNIRFNTCMARFVHVCKLLCWLVCIYSDVAAILSSKNKEALIRFWSAVKHLCHTYIIHMQRGFGVNCRQRHI